MLGEFGIGCNPGIQRYMKNTLFDEKMYGTIHLAIGAGLPTIGGKNRSSVHWDMVKDRGTAAASSATARSSSRTVVAVLTS